MPISRSTADRARRPSSRYSSGAHSRIAAVAAQASSRARLHSPRRCGSLLPISITAAMPEGPAISGMASGTMNGSPSGSSPSSPSGRGKIMRMPIRNRTMPPAMATDSWRRCISSRAYLPPHRKAISTPRAISSSRTSTTRWRCGGSGLSTLRNTGTLPSGSRIRNSSRAADRMVMPAGRPLRGPRWCRGGRRRPATAG